jgi:hypothetical protein
LIGEPAAWALLAATDVDVSQFTIANEAGKLLDGGLEPFGGFFRRP